MNSHLRLGKTTTAASIVTEAQLDETVATLAAAIDAGTAATKRAA